MEVVLLERVEKLGQMGDVVKVKNGYARNYLLPQKKALRANKENLSIFEAQRAQLEADNLKRRAEAEKVGEKLDGQAVVLIRAASESQQLYGSVSTQDIAKAVTEAGFTVTRKQIELDKVLKTLGLHDIKVRLHPEVAVGVTVNIARSAEEAEIQARGESVEEAAEAALNERDEAVVNVFESTADVDVEELEQVAAGEEPKDDA
ncbi:50S ribosomal protein L9 [Sneathiella sp. CAU 1612]|jgi:large subunit ribosomal protein L9|uniref:Large ribosomal subunit protein bL9 n=1 Tax=Sneathiella sedimenti TaxID=2816034 RepID=A0ABS3F7J9_9PROT|nr:50S ribosomal protein L9 [Sneathiella sedimenti]MBO0334507.1 50S ribosomal protein L9 [Sneathiella sedimenti]